MEPAWAAVIVTGGIQALVAVYIYGRMSARVDAFEKWKDEDAEPKLDEHDKRLWHIESKIR